MAYCSSKLIEAQLAPFIGPKGQQLELHGPEVLLGAKAVQLVGLSLHELATNATKYGALSVPGGKVTISWRFHEGGIAPEL